MLSDAIKKDEERPTKLLDRNLPAIQAASKPFKNQELRDGQCSSRHGAQTARPTPLKPKKKQAKGPGSETAEHQQDSSSSSGPTCQNHPPKKCLTLRSDAIKKDEVKPTKLRNRNLTAVQAASKPFKNQELRDGQCSSRHRAQTARPTPLKPKKKQAKGPGSATAEPQQDSSSRSGPTCQNHPPKKCLTLRSERIKKDEERPTKLLDRNVPAIQAASKPFKNQELRDGQCSSNSTSDNAKTKEKASQGAWFRNSGTPAGLKLKQRPNLPKPSPEKVSNVVF